MHSGEMLPYVDLIVDFVISSIGLVTDVDMMSAFGNKDDATLKQLVVHFFNFLCSGQGVASSVVEQEVCVKPFSLQYVSTVLQTL